LGPTPRGKQGTVVIRGRFRIALSLPVWVFRAFDGLSTSFAIFYLLLVLVKDLVICRFPPSSAAESVSPQSKVKRTHRHVPHVPPRQDHQTQTNKTSDDCANDHTHISALLRTGAAVSSSLDQDRRRHVNLRRLRGCHRHNRHCSDSTVRESGNRRYHGSFRWASCINQHG